MAEKRGQYIYNDDGSTSQLVHNTNETTENSVIAVDIQARMTQLIQTQAGVTILPNNGSNASAWIDSHVDGSPLTNLGVTVSMTSGTGMQVYVSFSHDGVNTIAAQNGLLYDGSKADVGTTTDVQLPSRYFRLVIVNKDATTPKTTTAYALLKA